MPSYTPLVNTPKYQVLTFAILAAGVMILPLLPVPSPYFVSGLPWKVELASSLFLFLVVAAMCVRARNSGSVPFSQGLVRSILLPVIFIAPFILWSGLSSLWSVSPASAWHHTLSWSVFLIVVVLVVSIGRAQRYVIGVFAVVAFVAGIASITDHASVVDFAASEGSIRIRYAKFAEMLVTILPVIWAASIAYKKRSISIILAAAGSVGWLAVMLSLSKGAFIAGIISFVLGFALLALFSRSDRVRTLRYSALWFGLTIALQIFFTFGSSTPSTVEYISGQADPSRSTTEMRLFTWKIARQMAHDNLLLGVGADNFGLRFNQARADFAHNHGETVTAEIAEDYMVERAHNEPLQILAELGIVGVILAAVPMITLAIWFALVLFRDRRASPIVLAAAAGIVGFFASSMVSSFSFRAIQNGIAVSILLGLIIRYLLRRSTATASLAALSDRKAIIGTRMIAAGALSLLIAFAFMSARSGLSRFYQYRAQYATEMTARAEMLETSIKLDNENAAALNSFSTVLAASGDVDSAAAALKRSIGLGGGVSQTYSVLADLYIKAGNYTLAEAAMHEAVSIFPGSVFARIRYAQTLEINQKSEEAATQTALAREIDLRQANGWRALIHDGDLNAFNASRRDDQIAAPAELRPMAAVYQFLEPERIITTSQ